MATVQEAMDAMTPIAQIALANPWLCTRHTDEELALPNHWLCQLKTMVDAGAVATDPTSYRTLLKFRNTEHHSFLEGECRQRVVPHKRHGPTSGKGPGLILTGNVPKEYNHKEILAPATPPGNYQEIIDIIVTLPALFQSMAASKTVEFEYWLLNHPLSKATNHILLDPNQSLEGKVTTYHETNCTYCYWYWPTPLRGWAVQYLQEPPRRVHADVRYAMIPESVVPIEVWDYIAGHGIEFK